MLLCWQSLVFIRERSENQRIYNDSFHEYLVTFQFRTFEFLTKEVWLYLPLKLTTVYYPVTYFASGAVAASLATAASYPFDVVRTRLVGQGEPKVQKVIVFFSLRDGKI